MDMETESEFGQGLTYCIGLFLAHAERVKGYKESFSHNWAGMWFNSAADHLYGLDVSCIKNRKLKKEIAGWRDKCLDFGLGDTATEKDVFLAIQQAKDFLREIDAKILKVKTIKGSWE